MNYNYKGYSADIYQDYQNQLRIVDIYDNKGKLIASLNRNHTEHSTATKCGIQIEIDKHIRESEQEFKKKEK